MSDIRYLSGVSTLRFNEESCVGCGVCGQVCPHGVFEMKEGKARIIDLDACMECGACALNCPVEALTVNPGVGCAHAIIKTWFRRGKRGSACSQTTCC